MTISLRSRTKELIGFLEILPRFRAWAKENKEEAHPVLRNGKADFLYSPQAAAWVESQGWNPLRFFSVMGRMAAALVIVEEGNDMSGTRPRDMPGVTEEELALAAAIWGPCLKPEATRRRSIAEVSRSITIHDWRCRPMILRDKYVGVVMLDRKTRFENFIKIL